MRHWLEGFKSFKVEEDTKVDDEFELKLPLIKVGEKRTDFVDSHDAVAVRAFG